VPVARSRVSTGKRGHRTPTGIFSIIQKRRYHRSNIYSGAPMPFMQRITWSGIALHQGVVPNHPASHGCIRLPRSFAHGLFKYTQLRTHVIIAEDDPTPHAIHNSQLFTPANPANEPELLPAAKAAAAPRTSILSRIALALTAPRPAATVLQASMKLLPDSPPAHNSAADIIAADRTSLLAHRRLMYSTRTQEPLRILIAPRPMREKIRQAQQLLTQLGYDAGDPDGLAGKQTLSAVRAFQAAQGSASPSGSIDENFFASLYRASSLTNQPDTVLYIRQQGRLIYSAPVELHGSAPVAGTFLYMFGNDGPEHKKRRWSAINLQSDAGYADRTRQASAIVDRIRIPGHVLLKVRDLLTDGSSLIITDDDTNRETGQMTDFIVLTKN